MIDVTFINHCEDECGLGSAEFDCVICKKMVIDYGELWYSQDEPDGIVVNVECESCRTKYELTKISYDEFESKETIDVVDMVNSILKEEIDKCGINRDENDCDDSSEY
jgi:hypothetical protein